MQDRNERAFLPDETGVRRDRRHLGVEHRLVERTSFHDLRANERGVDGDVIVDVPKAARRGGRQDHRRRIEITGVWGEAAE